MTRKKLGEKEENKRGGKRRWGRKENNNSEKRALVGSKPMSREDRKSVT